MSSKNNDVPSAWIRFLVPSSIGVGFFLVPFYYDGQITIGMAYIGDLLINNYKPQLSQAAGFFIACSLIASLLFAFNEGARRRFPALAEQLSLHPVWFTLRLFGFVCATAYLFDFGPEWLIGGNTSGTTLGNLIPITMTYFTIAAVFLPLLVDFGLMELVGVLLSKLFLRLFNLPGRSAIDAIASWMGSGPVGVFITSQQYERGFYSAREAAVICTNFSVVSVSFSLVVINTIGLGHLFLPFYFSVLGIGFIAALITPKLPPLRGIADVYIDNSRSSNATEFDTSKTLWQNAIHEALKRAGSSPPAAELAKRVASNTTELWLGVVPVVMGVGTLALILAEYTPLFTYLGYPIAPLLALMQLEEAAQAAPLMLIGFTDMFLPALVGSTIESELTRFVVATVSVCQLIYMSEVGAIIVKSKIPLGFFDVAAVFLLRTLIALPLAVLIGNILL
jgi:nucleoside recognition membrane protein YjiH